MVSVWAGDFRFAISGVTQTELMPDTGTVGSFWLNRFTVWHNKNELRALVNADAANLAWYEAPLLRSYLYLFSATESIFWIERFVFHTDSLLAMMRDFPEGESCWMGYQDGFVGWGTRRYDPNGFYQEYMVHDAVISLPIARFVALVYTTPGLQERFLSKAQRYQQVVEEEVIGKWFQNWGAVRGNGEDLEHFGGWDNLPLNQFLAFGELLMVMAEVRRSVFYLPVAVAIPDEFYSAVPDSMAEKFLFSLCVMPGLSDCWVWRHWLPGTGGDRWEDIAHANLDISFALTAAEREVVFRREELPKFARTFLRLVRDHHSDRLVLRRFVNGWGAADSVYALEMWAALGEFEPEVLAVVERALGTVPVERMNVSMAVTAARLVFEENRRNARERLTVPVGGQSAGVVAGIFKSGIDFKGAVFDASGRRVLGDGRRQLNAGVYFVSGGRMRRVLVVP